MLFRSMRMRVRWRRARGGAQPPLLFQAGEIAPHFLLPLAFQAPALLVEVIQEARRLLDGRQRDGIDRALLIPYDPQDPAFAGLADIERGELGIQLFARPIRREITFGERPLYLVPIDL